MDKFGIQRCLGGCVLVCPWSVIWLVFISILRLLFWMLGGVRSADVRFSVPGLFWTLLVLYSSYMGLTLGLIFDMSRRCWDLTVRTNAERLWNYPRTERLVLSFGMPKCKAFVVMCSTDQRDPKFQRILGDGANHLQLLMEIHRQSARGRWFLREDPPLQKILIIPAIHQITQGMPVHTCGNTQDPGMRRRR